MTYGWEVRQPGFQAEVARLEFSDAGVYIVADRLRQNGRFEYRERQPTLNDWTRNHPIRVVAMLVFLALIVTVIVAMRSATKNARRARERERLEAEAAKTAARAAALAELRRAEAAKTAARAAALAELRRLAAEAQSGANSLPIILGEAEMTLDRARDELRSGLYSPFWEALEVATARLGVFHQTLSLIESRKTTYHAQAAQLGGDAPAFSLGVSVLPDPAATHRRLITLYREAQLNPDHAKVYEQRRTNAILIAGFTSLEQAIEGIGDRVVDAISSLAASSDCRLASLESSLESAANAAAEQSAALRAELQRSSAVDNAVLDQLRQDAEVHSERGRLALRMLDNIQRRRRPTVFERP
ncbi:MAG: hypothetical protein ABSE56_06515 [Bryobacteraceae bacterium]|jgi:hypothetical protein